jgi:hypothetical protein
MGILNELLDKLEISVRSDTESVLHGQKINNKKIQELNKFSNEKVLNERSEKDEVFFNSVFEQTPILPPTNIAQISVKKESYLPLYTPKPVEDVKALKELVSFFIYEPYINIYNFNRAEKCLARFVNFKALKDIEELRAKLSELQEEFDKSTSSQDKFGKALIKWSLRTNGIKISLVRPKMQGFKQYIAINFNKESEITVLNCWAGKTEKHEFIKSRSQSKIHKKHQKNSIAFDAQVWKSFNVSGILACNYTRTLECLERNRNTLPELIQEINKKQIMQIIYEPYLNNVTIKSDNNETAFLSFLTNSSQKVDIKLCSYASSITIG